MTHTIRAQRGHADEKDVSDENTKDAIRHLGPATRLTLPSHAVWSHICQECVTLFLSMSALLALRNATSLIHDLCP